MFAQQVLHVAPFFLVAREHGVQSFELAGVAPAFDLGAAEPVMRGLALAEHQPVDGGPPPGA